MARVLFMKNIPFNNQYTNVLHYKPMKDVVDGINVNKITLTEFLKHYDSNYLDTSKYIRYNFNMGNITTTSINVDVTNDSSLLNSNYVHIRKDNENELPSNLEEAFYFVTNITQYNRNIYRFDLELDVWTTYDKELTFKDLLFTERKHCYRWSGDALEGKMLYSDYAMLPDLIDDKHKAIFTKSVKTLEPVTGYEVDDALSKLKGASNWKYTFATLTKELKAHLFLYNKTSKKMEPLTSYDSDLGNKYESTKLELKDSTIDVDLNYCIFIQPSNIEVRIDKDYIDETIQGSIVDYGRIHAIDEFVETSSILGIKLNNSIPKEVIDNTNFYVNSGLNDVVDYRDVDGSGQPLVVYYSPNTSAASPLFALLMLRTTKSSEVTYNVDVTNTIISDSLYGKVKLKNIDYEPKLFTSPYMIQGVKLFYSECYENPLYYYEPAEKTLQVKKRSLCLLNENIESYYYYNTETYYTLYNGESNMSMSLNNPCDLPYDIDAYKQAMATSRNSMTTGMLTGTASSLSKGVFGAIASGSTGNVLGATESLVGGAIGAISEVINYSAKLDDLRNTPNSMASSGSSMTFNASVDDIQPKYVTYELPVKEKEIVFDYYYNYGYMINKMCVWNDSVRFVQRDDIDTEKDALLLRKLFNYVKITDKDIINKMNFDAPLPIKETIANIFQNGVKVWTLIQGDSLTKDELLDSFLSEKYENWEWL